MISFKEYISENWQRAVLRRHGSVKPGHWNGKRFISDMKHADNETAGFDHERCKSINAQVEVNGKVVAGGMKKIEENQQYFDTSVKESADLPVTTHKDPHEGADIGEYTETFPGSPLSAQKFAKHVISKGGKARIGKRGQTHYVYHKGAGPISKDDYVKR